VSGGDELVGGHCWRGYAEAGWSWVGVDAGGRECIEWGSGAGVGGGAGGWLT